MILVAAMLWSSAAGSIPSSGRTKTTLSRWGWGRDQAVMVAGQRGGAAGGAP